MAAAFAVVLSREEALAVVVIEDDVLAFVPDDVADAVEIFCVFGYQKSSRRKRSDQPGGVDIAAFVIYGTRVLGGSDRDIGRILAIDVLETIGLCDEDRVVSVIEVSTITVLTGDGKEVRQAVIDSRKHRRIWRINSIDSRSFGRFADYGKVIAAYAFGLADQIPALGVRRRRLKQKCNCKNKIRGNSV